MCLAVIAMNIATFSATGTAATYRTIAREGFHPAELNLMRNSIAFFVSIIWCYFTDTNPFNAFPTEKKLPLLIRMTMGQSAFLFTNIAASLIPLSILFICRQTSPFWTSILAFLALREPISPLEVFAICLCFGAVVLIALQQKEEVDEEDFYDKKQLGLILALCSGLTNGLIAVSSRSMKVVRPQVIMFYYSLFGYSASVIFIFVEMAFMSEPQSRLGIYTGRQYLIALAAASFDIGSFTGNTVAYQSDKSGFVALISYMSVVYAFLCD